jgi:hypothetical protein
METKTHPLVFAVPSSESIASLDPVLIHFPNQSNYLVVKIQIGPKKNTNIGLVKARNA